jgi:hypothetical protein
MTFLSGNTLDSNDKVRKNQHIEKDTNLYLENNCFAQYRIPAKNEKLINTGHAKMLLEMEKS